MKNLRRLLLFAISCLSLLMSGYICYRVNTDPAYIQDDSGDLKAPEVSFQIHEQGIAISWKKVKGAENYRIARKEKGGSWEVYDYTEAASYDDHGVEPGKIYYYRVYGCTVDRTGPASESVKVLWLAKPEITAVQAQADGVLVSWQPVSSAGYYYVYRSEDGEKFEKVSDRIRELSFVDSSVLNGHTYFYCVKAANSNNLYVSARSDVLSIDF